MDRERYGLRSAGYQRPPLRPATAASTNAAATNHYYSTTSAAAAAAGSRSKPISRISTTPAPFPARAMSQQDLQPAAAATAATAGSASDGGIGNMTYEQREQLREIFDTMDRAGRGFIPTSKLGDILKLLGLGKPSRDALQNWAVEIDPSGTGRVDYGRLELFVSLRYDEADQRQEIMDAFRLFKPDAKEIEHARITLADLQKIAAHLGEHIPEEELREMINIADVGEAGGVNLVDFTRIMRKAGLY